MTTETDSRPTHWLLWARDYGPSDPVRFRDAGQHKGYALEHGDAEPIVQVLFTEDPEGGYRGWLPAGTHLHHLEMVCAAGAVSLDWMFGLERSERAGLGRIVRLRAEPVPAAG